MTAWIFPGQGAQKRGMGKELFDEAEYRAVEHDVDAILGYSLRQVCLEDPGNALKKTEYTQPCLYVVNALHYLNELRRGSRPAFLAGHSLGEYNALHAAGVFDFLTGLKLVKRRGELMGQATGGGMAAIVGPNAEYVRRTLAGNGFADVDLANFNSRSQVVISGPSASVQQACKMFEQSGARLVMPLQVSAAFHSRYMVGASQTFAEFLAPFAFSAPRTPVISNVTAQPYPGENASESVKRLLVRQISGCVQWMQSVVWMLDAGVMQFRELGPSNVLTRLIQQIELDRASMREPHREPELA